MKYAVIVAVIYAASAALFTLAVLFGWNKGKQERERQTREQELEMIREQMAFSQHRPTSIREMIAETEWLDLQKQQDEHETGEGYDLKDWYRNGGAA